jgi:hypothetical protein
MTNISKYVLVQTSDAAETLVLYPSNAILFLKFIVFCLLIVSNHLHCLEPFAPPFWSSLQLRLTTRCGPKLLLIHSDGQTEHLVVIADTI